MKVIADFSLVTIGDQISISEYVAACHRHLVSCELKTNLHALGVNVEGEMLVVLSAINECHKIVHSLGAQRIMTHLKLTTRTDRDQSIEEKINSVRRKG